ncbi:hypothetical protein [Geobacillus zalihae]|uniref:hypothetical protein n=1 Tax=Geobacillus zalihae TaxID=213419 RepID=UPI0009BD9791|nr:hypothetical protein [Geobacillus zalihae]OQP16059.1 hypothetical protein B1693_10270 [Geobacillus zalihae]QNU23904.1 hypothetical protein IC806_12590 [Geobacillus zalihae]
MKKRHKQRIPQFGCNWQIWYQPICLPLACSRGDDGPLLLDPKKCSGMLANPSEYSEFEMFEQARRLSINMLAMHSPAPLIERLAGSMAKTNGSTREQKKRQPTAAG